jgi:hypothetical protein
VQQQDRTAERIIAGVAGKQWGLVERSDLVSRGVTPEQIRQRLRRGSLLEQHPGVYRVGHRAPSIEAAYMAAALACGDGSLVAGRAASYLWRLIKGTPPPPEVIALTERHIPGVITHRARRQPGLDAGVCRRIPVTTVARTLVDLAAVLSLDELALACHEAGVLYGTTPRQVDAVLQRRPGSRGAGALRQVMIGNKRVTLSRLEAAFLDRLKSAGLPSPSRTSRPAGVASTAAGLSSG